MRVQITPNTVKLWASARDTYKWANRDGARWPCSQLENRRFFAEFDANGLLNFTLDGRDGAPADANEFNACTSDLLRARLPVNHPAHFVAVGQHCAPPVR